MSEYQEVQREGARPFDRGGSLRLFVSVQLSDEWRQAAEQVAQALQATHGREYRWVRPELYHVTVVFLGELPRERLDDVEDALRAATVAVPPFELQMGGLSGFGVDVPRALILAVSDPSGGLRAVRQRLDQELTERRIPYDRKALRPHLTLGRARVQRGGGRRDRSRRGQSEQLTAAPRPDVGSLDVTAIALVKSDLLPGGPRYEALTRVPLGG